MFVAQLPHLSDSFFIVMAAAKKPLTIEKANQKVKRFYYHPCSYGSSLPWQQTEAKSCGHTANSRSKLEWSDIELGRSFDKYRIELNGHQFAYARGFKSTLLLP